MFSNSLLYRCGKHCEKDKKRIEKLKEPLCGNNKIFFPTKVQYK